MTLLKVTAETTQDLALGAGTTRAFFSTSLHYIPGSTLRGAIAAAFRVAHGDGNPQFRELFDGSVRFGPMLAEGSDVANQSVRERKYPAASSGPRFRDEAFSGDTTGFAGDYLKGEIRWARPNTKVVTSTAIHPGRKTALESALFAQETHRRGTVFAGHIAGSPELLERLTSIDSVFIGARTSVMGRVRLGFGDIAEVSIPADRRRVVLRTLSPTILIDGAGRSTGDLASLFPDNLVERVWGSRLIWEGVSGWHMASGLPKPGERALAPGTVIALDSPTEEQLRYFLGGGIGTRRAEGFGWLEIVPHAWTPPETKSDAPVAEPERSDESWQRLNPQVRRWLAGHLKSGISSKEEGFEGALKRLRATATGKNIADVEWDEIVVPMLRDTPGPQRNALASRLERN